MGKINLGRVILGGLVAGVIINVVEGVMNGVILQPQWSAAAKAIGRSATMSTKQIVAFNVWGFAAGIIAVWLYAAMRPRFGAGPRTAITAGAAVWLLAYAMANAMMALRRSRELARVCFPRLTHRCRCRGDRSIDRMKGRDVPTSTIHQTQARLSREGTSCLGSDR